MQKQLQFYPSVERNCTDFMKCDWFLTPKFHYSVWGEDLSPELCIIDPQSQAFASRLHFSWRQDETWWQCRRDADYTDWYQHTSTFSSSGWKNMYSVSSDGSCGFVTEQSKPLGFKKKGQQWHSAFSNFCCLYSVCTTCAACTTCTVCQMQCQIRKVENLPKTVAAFLDPTSQSQLWNLEVSMNVHARRQRLKDFYIFGIFFQGIQLKSWLFILNEIPHDIANVSKSLFFQCCVLQHRMHCMTLDSLHDGAEGWSIRGPIFRKEELEYVGISHWFQISDAKNEVFWQGVTRGWQDSGWCLHLIWKLSHRFCHLDEA